MSNTSTTSPFVQAETEETWVTWTEQISLIGLREELQTEGRSFTGGKCATEDTFNGQAKPFHQAVPINRPQYNAVLNRMNLAKRNTGSFTSWSV